MSNGTSEHDDFPMFITRGTFPGAAPAHCLYTTAYSPPSWHNCSVALLLTMARPNWDFEDPNNDSHTTFATASFAEGASRRAYRAMRWKPASKYRQKAVVKEYKAAYAWAQGDWDTAISIYEKTKKLAGKFNTVSKPNRPIRIVDYGVQKVTSRPDHSTPKLGEYILVEDYLEGDFQKFISNAGWVKSQCMTSCILMPTFAHWTWVHTRGQLMVADLQGVRYDDKYVLTDPCILSVDRNYGATDLALIGMALFFLTHRCTDICRSLDIARKRPNPMRLGALEQYIQTHVLTSYQIPTSYLSREDYERIPMEIREKIRAEVIACLFN